MAGETPPAPQSVTTAIHDHIRDVKRRILSDDPHNNDYSTSIEKPLPSVNRASLHVEEKFDVRVSTSLTYEGDPDAYRHFRYRGRDFVILEGLIITEAIVDGTGKEQYTLGLDFIVARADNVRSWAISNAEVTDNKHQDETGIDHEAVAQSLEAGLQLKQEASNILTL